MKRAINILSLTVIAAALAALAFFYWPGRTARASAFAEFPPGKRRVINLDSNYGALDGLSRREKIDQLRDWLLFTVVSDAGLSADQVNQVMFDVPAIRRGYMQPVANFEYGEARSRYLGNGLVVALLPAD